MPEPGTIVPATPALTGFGRFTFDTRTGELRRDGIVVKLAPKPAQALRLLLASAGQVVLRDELVAQLWTVPPLEVDRSLNFAIRQIREALGDDANNPVFVETLPRRGYRFIAPVADHVPAATMTGPDTPVGPGRRTRRTGAAAVGVAVSLVGLATFGLTRTAADAPTVPMLAVLPLEHRSDSAPIRYLAAGVRDELIAELARLGPERLGVIARESSSRQANAPLEDIAQRLGVGYVLRGSVTPRAGSAHVAFQLVDAHDGRVLWADRFDGVPVAPDLERRVAEQVAAALSIRLVTASTETAASRREPTPEARAHYLKAAYLMQSQSWEQFRDGMALLRSALDLDSSYAPAHVLYGSALLRIDDPAGRDYLETALRHDPLTTGAHVALADDDLYRRWDFAGAEHQFALARRLHPGEVQTHHRYAYYLSLLGRHDEALAAVRTALRLDPVSPLVTGDVGRLYYRAGRYDEAEQYCRQASELVENNANARACLLNLRLVQGDVEGARQHLPALLDANGAPADLKSSLAGMSARASVDAYWQWRAESLETRRTSDRDVLVPLAQAYVWLGRLDDALTALETARDRQSPLLPLVAGDPCFAPLFGHPRYDAVFLAAGLPLTAPPGV